MGKSKGVGEIMQTEGGLLGSVRSNSVSTGLELGESLMLSRCPRSFLCSFPICF